MPGRGGGRSKQRHYNRQGLPYPYAPVWQKREPRLCGLSVEVEATKVALACGRPAL
jgi:hypothetical protein